jgi:hypothetical protein
MIKTLRNLIEYNSVLLENINFNDAKEVLDSLTNGILQIPGWNKNKIEELKNNINKNIIKNFQEAINNFENQQKIKFVKYYLQKYNESKKLLNSINNFSNYDSNNTDAWKAFIQYKDTPNKPPELQEKFNNFLKSSSSVDLFDFEHEVLSWRSGKTKAKTGPVNTNNIEILQGSFKGPGWFVFIPKNWDGAKQFSYIKKPAEWPYKKDSDENDNEVHPRWCTVLSKHYFDSYTITRKGTLYSCINYNEGRALQFWGVRNDIKGEMDSAKNKFFKNASAAEETDNVSLKYADDIIKEKGITNETKEKIFGKVFLSKFNKEYENEKEYKPFKKEANNLFSQNDNYKIYSIPITLKSQSNIFDEINEKIPGIKKYLIQMMEIIQNSRSITKKLNDTSTQNNKDSIIHIIIKPNFNKKYYFVLKNPNEHFVFKNGELENIYDNEKNNFLDDILARKRLTNFKSKREERENNTNNINNRKKYFEEKDKMEYEGIYDKREGIYHIFILKKGIKVFNTRIYKIMIKTGTIGYRQIVFFNSTGNAIPEEMTETGFKKSFPELWNEMIHFSKYKQAIKDAYIEYNPFKITGNNQERLATFKHLKEEKEVNYMKTFKTLVEESLSVESAYTQLQELLKAQQELQAFSKANPAIAANQNYQRILQQLNLQGQGLNKSLQTLIAQKKQSDLQNAKAQQQSGQITPINQQTSASPQVSTTPNQNVPTAANGVAGVPRKIV